MFFAKIKIDFYLTSLLSCFFLLYFPGCSCRKGNRKMWLQMIVKIEVFGRKWCGAHGRLWFPWSILAAMGIKKSTYHLLLQNFFFNYYYFCYFLQNFMFILFCFLIYLDLILSFCLIFLLKKDFIFYFIIIIFFLLFLFIY